MARCSLGGGDGCAARLLLPWPAQDVEKRFGRYGKVTEVRIVREPNGKSRGFGFVAMDNGEDVKEVGGGGGTCCGAGGVRNSHGAPGPHNRFNLKLCVQSISGTVLRSASAR